MKKASRILMALRFPIASPKAWAMRSVTLGVIKPRIWQDFQVWLRIVLPVQCAKMFFHYPKTAIHRFSTLNVDNR